MHDDDNNASVRCVCGVLKIVTQKSREIFLFRLFSQRSPHISRLFILVFPKHSAFFIFLNDSAAPSRTLLCFTLTHVVVVGSMNSHLFF